MTPIERWTHQDRAIGRHVLVYDTIDSTNAMALKHAEDPSHDGLAFLAREQTAGRGQYGRSWQAPPGSSVLMSLLLFPPLPLRRPPLLTAWAAVSVCESIHQLTELPAQIKWPNDILIHGKKVCGILIEQRTTGHAASPLASVVGIGLNLTQTQAMFDQAGLPDAVSLALLHGRPHAFDAVAHALLAELDAQYAAMQAGNLVPLESLWQDRLGLLGKSVIVEAIDRRIRGQVIALSLDGIELATAERATLRLSPESIRHIHRVDSGK